MQSLKNLVKSSSFFSSSPPVVTQQPNSLVSFPVDPVTHGPLLPKLDSRWINMAWKSHGKVETFAMNNDVIDNEGATLVKAFSTQNLLAEAVHMAFYKHYPLVLTPDVIWLTIMQGFANHVDQNAEALRGKFVAHKGKKKLVIMRPEFVKGSPDNDWTTVFPEFTAKIAQDIGEEKAASFACDFSTSTQIEMLAGDITLMDTVQHYYEYEIMCGCGIPSISLRGTPEDWTKLRAKAETLKEYDLDFWLEALLPVLDHFASVANGNEPDLVFWRSICNFYGASGTLGEPITGWLQAFFPYLNGRSKKQYDRFDNNTEKPDAPNKPGMVKNDSVNGFMKAYKFKTNAASYNKHRAKNKWSFRVEEKEGAGCAWGVKLEDIPPGVASAPLLYTDVTTGNSYNMAMMAGLTGLVQHPNTRALELVVGYGVVEKDN